MSIKDLKLELVQLVLETQEEKLLQKIKVLFENKQADWWEKLSLEEQNEIKKGLDQAKKGEVISHEEVMHQFKEWH